MQSQAQETPQTSQSFLILSRFMTASVILSSILQGVFFFTERLSTTYGTAAIWLAVTSIFLALRVLRRRDNRLLGLLLILYCGQLTIYVVELIDVGPPFPLRVLQVAICASYLAVVMAIFLAVARILTPANAILFSLSLWTGIFLSEISLELLMPRTDSKHVLSVPEWSGGMELHPTLGMVYKPYSLVKTYYPDNPRGYFEEEDTKISKWRLQVLAGNVAQLVSPSDNLDAIRVAIRKGGTQDTWGVQLNQDRFTVKAYRPYSMTFRARADSPRSIIAGLAKGHEPWSNLGLWKNIELTKEWQSFQEEFTASTDEDNARIHFDVGRSDVSVEFSNLSLRSLPDGTAVVPDLPGRKFFVSYRFNALGCRGHNFQIPRTSKTARILLLGDSFTQGVGVHEQDTVANQLERLLTKQSGVRESPRNHEVINCGVTGFSTKDERLFYQLLALKYEPDVVLLVMVWNDDLSHVEELQRGYANRPREKLEYMFHLWGQLQEYYHRRPFPDFSRSVEEIHLLKSEVGKHGARLGVVLFRNNCDFTGATLSGRTWNHLAKSVAEGLHAAAIPILDLGNALCGKHSEEDLAVHPLDLHPNEIANEIAAQTILNYLRTEMLLTPQRDSQGNHQGIIGPRG